MTQANGSIHPDGQSHHGPRYNWGRWAAFRDCYIAPIERLIRTVAEEDCGADSPLIEMLMYSLASGGSRTRAIVPLLVADELSADVERVLPFAAACEVLHNATLIHDDVQDGDRVRRGRPSTPEQFGVPRAINLGDVMLFLSLGLLHRLEIPAPLAVRCTRQLVLAAIRLGVGQERDLSQRLPERAGVMPSRRDYFDLVQGKTSSLFSLALATSAELCGADGATVAALAAVAGELGPLFQIQDDIVDIYGDKGRGGQRRDLIEGKRTFLVVVACERLRESDARDLIALLDVPPDRKSTSDLAQLREFLTCAGALAGALGEIESVRQRIQQRAPERFAPLVELLVGRLLAPLAHLGDGEAA